MQPRRELFLAQGVAHIEQGHDHAGDDHERGGRGEAEADDAVEVDGIAAEDQGGLKGGGV